MADSTSGAKTLERGLALLDHVANGITRLDGIAAAAGMSRSSTHRMLSSLVNTGFLSLDANHEYHLGIKLLVLGSHAQATIDVSREVQSVLEELSRRTLDASHLGIRVDADVLYLAKARGHRGIEMMSRPGARLRAQNTAMGKVLLAALPDDTAASLYDPSARPTPNSARTVEDFLAGLARVRSAGYAIEDQENELGITCIAIPIPDHAGQVQAAVSVSAPTVYMPPERRPEVAGQLRDVQPLLTQLLPPGFENRWAARSLV